MQKMISTLTDRQRYWLNHVQACEASGQSMTEYSAVQGISVQTMYAGKKTLVNKGILPNTQPTHFQRLQVMDAAVSSQWRIGLPNGVSVAFAGEVDARALGVVLSTAASLE